MPATPTLARLLDELQRGAVPPVRYSRRSVYGTCEPLVLTTLLALLAVLGGMLLGGPGDRVRPSTRAVTDRQRAVPVAGAAGSRQP